MLEKFVTHTIRESSVPAVPVATPSVSTAPAPQPAINSVPTTYPAPLQKLRAVKNGVRPITTCQNHFQVVFTNGFSIHNKFAELKEIEFTENYDIKTES